MEEMISYGEMPFSLWRTFTTPTCSHEIKIALSEPQKQPNLGPDAAAVLGYDLNQLWMRCYLKGMTYLFEL